MKNVDLHSYVGRETCTLSSTVACLLSGKIGTGKLIKGKKGPPVARLFFFSLVSSLFSLKESPAEKRVKFVVAIRYDTAI